MGNQLLSFEPKTLLQMELMDSMSPNTADISTKQQIPIQEKYDQKKGQTKKIGMIEFPS
jgi:hypothetical protein